MPPLRLARQARLLWPDLPRLRMGPGRRRLSYGSRLSPLALSPRGFPNPLSPFPGAERGNGWHGVRSSGARPVYDRHGTITRSSLRRGRGVEIEERSTQPNGLTGAGAAWRRFLGVARMARAKLGARRATSRPPTTRDEHPAVGQQRRRVQDERFSSPATVHLPVAGSYIAALDIGPPLLCPPATSTLPVASSVAV